MKTRWCILIFGMISGLLWSLVPDALVPATIGGGSLIASPGETLTVLGAGVLTGVGVSFLVYLPLARLGRKNPVRRVLVAGILSLPAGAFLFGVVVSSLQLVVHMVTGAKYPFVEHGFAPVATWFIYALFSVASFFVIGCLPFAIFTTWLFHRLAVKERPTMRSSERPSAGAAGSRSP
jgi:hypothetical protein